MHIESAHNESRHNDSSHGGLSRRSLLAAFIAAPALAGVLASCGDPTVESASSDVPSAGIAHPTGADEVVIRIGYEGGFVPRGYAFTNMPNLLISGDGRLFTPGVQTAIFPGPLLPALNVRTISEAGIQKVLELANTAHLLQTPPDYSAEIQVADASDTVVTINADGQSFRHQAPALGFDTPEQTEARKSLQKFVEMMGDITTVVGAENLGPEAPFAADAYRLQATPVTDEELAGYDPAPTKVAWPAGTGVALADAAECTEVAADKVGTALTDATQTTFFTEGDVTYQVAAIAKLPGDHC